jgi:hypothetical protein
VPGGLLAVGARVSENRMRFADVVFLLREKRAASAPCEARGEGREGVGGLCAWEKQSDAWSLCVSCSARSTAWRESAGTDRVSAPFKTAGTLSLPACLAPQHASEAYNEMGLHPKHP